MDTGIYIITNKVNGKIYIGSTSVSFKTRFSSHIRSLKRGSHANSILQKAWDKYGEDNFLFEILDEQPREYCASIEQWWINMTQCCNRDIGYNICTQVGNTIGYKFTDEQKANISNALKGKLAGEKHPMWGKKREPTTLGYKHSEESIEKMCKFQRQRVRSEKEIQSLKKLNEEQVGEKHPRYGVKLTGEHLEKVRNLRKGIPADYSWKAVLVFDMDDNFIEEIESVTKAAKLYNTQPTKVSDICNGKRKSIGRKFKFKFK